MAEISPEMKEAAQELMVGIVRQIAMLPIDLLNSIVEESQRSQSHWDSFGAIVDPTAWCAMNHNGTFDHAKIQLEVVKHIRDIRVAAQKMDAIVKEQYGIEDDAST